VLFTDGVTEARGHVDHDLYGEDRLRDIIAGLGDMSAARIADTIQQAALAFNGGASSDDTVALVLKVPRYETSGQPWEPPGAREPSVRSRCPVPRLHGVRRRDRAAGAAHADLPQ
jgi:Stage II sporulation protein E (SpoIIE)